tara:strand:+ start:8375 stop:8782 length:408 start_codon:yes stop_codon:yes gene_type:complete
MKSICFLLSFVALIAGCSSAVDGPPRYKVSGEVSYDGKPVPAGYLVIEPDHELGNQGPQARLEIVNGMFTTRSGKGAISGPVIVRIYGMDGIPDEEKGLNQGASLFDEYITKLELPAENSVHTFVVPKSNAAKTR